MIILKTKEGVVPANENTIMFTDVVINDDSIIEVYFDNPSVYVIAISQVSDKVFVTCSPHLESVGIKLFINNVEEFSPYDDTDLKSRVAQTEQDIVVIESDLSSVHSAVTSHSNEIINMRGDIGTIEGNITELDTRVDECFQSVSNGKSLVASAITGKGVATDATASFQTMATNISNIPSGGGEGRRCFEDVRPWTPSITSPGNLMVWVTNPTKYNTPMVWEFKKYNGSIEKIDFDPQKPYIIIERPSNNSSQKSQIGLKIKSTGGWYGFNWNYTNFFPTWNQSTGRIEYYTSGTGSTLYMTLS